jgi:predicted ATPase/DNA-binding CsgD family transcriptional regulator
MQRNGTVLALARDRGPEVAARGLAPVEGDGAGIPLWPVPTSLVGRSGELAAVQAALADPGVRLVTLTGPPGSGTSRLASAVAEAAVAAGETVGRVDLADADTTAAVRRAVQLVQTAQVAGGPGGRALLVLDNCRTGAADAAGPVAELLAADQGLTVLATGHQPLRVYGESRFALGPLPLPTAEDRRDPHQLGEVPSVALFTERARAASRTFELTRANADVVADLCAALDGLPLAIELAAARTHFLPPRALADRLAQGLDVLQTQAVGALSAHRSMGAAIQAAHDRLPAAERELLRRLTVFPGRFSVDEAVAVAAAGGVEATLESLLDRSLLTAVPKPTGEPRFRLLRTVRAFAQDELRRAGEVAATRQRLARYVLAVAAGGPGTVCRDSVLAAARWLVLERDAGGAVTVLTRLSREVRGPAPAVREVAEQAAQLCRWQGEPAAGTAAAGLAGQLAAAEGDLATADRLLSSAVELARVATDDAGLAAALTEAGVVAARAQDPARARMLLVEAAGLVPDPAALTRLAAVLAGEGDQAGATARATEAAQLAAGLGDPRGEARARALLALVTADGPEPARAVGLARTALRTQWELEDHGGLPASLEVLARLEAGADPGRAGELLGAAAALRARTGVGALPVEARSVAATTDRVRAALGRPAADEAIGRGAEAPVEEVVEQALTAPAPAAPVALATPAGTPLTPREREVAALVSAGMTNRQIARRLGIAEWTAVNHVRHIMRKLECPSRIHVAQWMAAHPD